ncbi:hypothetical protein ACFPAF_07530 [Hymenobacter endophyticus]|uniref:Uncharacterized protein n=1 Tax=Hymenobacter endophyticus TaxID=3076335 RepID=A0ABU3TFT6_9BACT|nr:hypothetical protein [Hymenobacter endophyticus]MDU0370236.1 hypothetical protein [Hymenobacter endophyticus]
MGGVQRVKQSLILLVGLLGVLILGCNQEKVRPEDQPTNREAKSTARKQEVFSKNREFIYQVSRFESGRWAVVDTVVLTSSGVAWRMDSTQKGIGWHSRTSNISSKTGVEESAGGIWIHPPRFDQYAILELSPFPEIKQPPVTGQQWDWELEVGSQWSNPAWAVWKGRMLVKTHYQTVGEQPVTTRLGQLTCQRVTAVARCTQGRSTLDLLFHPRYGFVLLDYVNIDGKRLRFELLSTGTTNQFDGAEYFGKGQFKDLL